MLLALLSLTWPPDCFKPGYGMKRWFSFILSSSCPAYNPQHHAIVGKPLIPIQ